MLVLMVMGGLCACWAHHAITALWQSSGVAGLVIVLVLAAAVTITLSSRHNALHMTAEC